MWQYCLHGVWSDTRPIFRVNLIKTVNITAKSFLNTDVQSQACSLTYRTLLAVVPALALLFAIGRGFGFQNLLQDELFKLFPSQKEAIGHALRFVDSYLNQASEGIFVGVGIVFLLWTLISLISSVEDSFNLIWGIKQGRNIWRKITDYTAMFLILPVLMICGSGFSIFLNNTIQQIFNFDFLTPLISWLFELASYLFTCMFFMAMFMLVPNARVRLKNAAIAGVFTGTGFLVLQWIFVTGQMYVARYNAIYGSFSFLPLLLIWLQLVWVIILSGSLICYASQNIFQYSFIEQISEISRDYYEKVTIAIVAVVTQRFKEKQPPITEVEITRLYGIPSRLVSQITDKMRNVGIFSEVVIDAKHEVFGYQPAIAYHEITLNTLRNRLNMDGKNNFIPDFDKEFPGVVSVIDTVNQVLKNATDDIIIADIDIKKSLTT